jgi:hypothetical protein
MYFKCKFEYVILHLGWGGRAGGNAEFNRLLINYPPGGTTYITPLQGMTSWMTFHDRDLDEYRLFE